MSGDDLVACVASLRLATAKSRLISAVPSEVGDDPRRRCKILAADVFASPISLTGHIHAAILRGSGRLPKFTLHATVIGGVAQLGERVNGIHEVRGSIPLASIAADSPSAEAAVGTSLRSDRCRGVTVLNG